MFFCMHVATANSGSRHAFERGSGVQDKNHSFIRLLVYVCRSEEEREEKWKKVTKRNKEEEKKEKDPHLKKKKKTA